MQCVYYSKKKSIQKLAQRTVQLLRDLQRSIVQLKDKEPYMCFTLLFSLPLWVHYIHV